MKVKYIEETWHWLTRNRIYDVLDESGGSYRLKDDKKDIGWWDKFQFEVISEEPEQPKQEKVEIAEDNNRWNMLEM